MATLVLTIIGDDRPGLVDALSAVIAEHGGNWEESRMAHLANKFAGILLVKVPDGKVDSMTEALRALRATGLQVTVEHSSETPSPARRTLHLELVGQDHPGIVHDIAHALATRDISIEELSTETYSASMAGGTLFEARATLSVPESVANEELRDLLESLADELMVDISLEQELL